MQSLTARTVIVMLAFISIACALDIGIAHAELDSAPYLISSEATDSLGLALGDMDGDGDLDVALANKSIPSQVFRNDGAGNFTLMWQQPEFVAAANDVKWGDLDGDGDLDLVFVYDAESQVYRNDVNTNPASGQLFVSIWQSPRDGGGAALAIGDLDGDGRLDLVVASDTGGTHVVRNQGGFVFDIAAQVPIAAQSVDLADMDWDGDLDIALGAQYLPVLRNQGSFAFDQLQAAPESYYPFERARWGDAENDGDIDLLAIAPSYGSGVVLMRYTAGTYEFIEARQFYADLALSDLAWADYDSDGDLDIILSSGMIGYIYWGCGCIQVLANDGAGTFTPAWDSKPDSPGFSAVVLGDLDMDGDLDIAGSTLRGGVQTTSSRSRYYRQSSTIEFKPTAYIGSSQSTGPRRSLIADLDLDGDLDAVESWHSFYVVMRNDGGLAFTTIGLGTDLGNDISAIAAGDMDLDGDLDIAIGFFGSPLQVWRNDGDFSFVKVWDSSSAALSTSHISWIDMDADGFPDLVVGGLNTAIYHNLGNYQFSVLWNDTSGISTSGFAVQDVDLDGDSDVAFARAGLPPVVMLNNGAGLLETSWIAPESLSTATSVALGDLDLDGFPDLVLGSRTSSSQILRNMAGTHFEWRANIAVDDNIQALGLGDFDGDGDLDLGLVGNGMTSSVWVVENRGNYVFSLTWRSNARTNCEFCTFNDSSVVWADMDDDARLDLVVGGDSTRENTCTTVYRRVDDQVVPAAHHLPIVAVRTPNTASSPTGGVGRIADRQIVAVPFKNSSSERAPLAWPDAAYSLNGGGTWVKVRGDSNAWHPGSSEYLWNVFASGFFGQSDYVVFRVRALAQSPIPHPANTFLFTNTVAGSFQYTARVSTSSAFRVRGTQVQVVRKDSSGVAQAIVYRLMGAGPRTAEFMADGAGVAFRTTGFGWLQGRGQLENGDKLAALYPVSPTEWMSFTQSVNFYLTSAAATAQTLAMQPVMDPGVQVLTVTVDNKLLLVNLDVALEWDARKDVQFMGALKFNLQRTSDLLFDWTNGQAALGQVRIFHDAKRYPVGGINPWEDSHIRIYASNRMRPNAAVGGIISPTLLYTEMVTVNGQTKEVEYGPGQVHMGAIWNRYGETSGNLGDDWARALAHELGHYVFFLEDNYLGLDEHGLLVTVKVDGDQGCPGAMNDPYRDDQSEFHPFTGWDSPGCQNTLSQRSTGRSDWQSIAQFYHLNQPAEPFAGINQGPNIQPLAVTQLQEISPTAAVDTLDVPIFTLLRGESEGGGTYLPSANAQAFLFQGGWLTDLGQPTLDQLQAWGARVGKDDHLCLLEPGLGYYGCEQVQADNTQLTVEKQQMWQPEIVVSSVNSYTIAVSGTMPPISDTGALDDKFQVCGRLYPVDEPAQAGELVAVGAGAYTHTFALTKTPTLEGYVHVWIVPAGSSCAAEPVGAASLETVTSYAVGGNPIHRRARRTSTRGDGVHRRARRVPVISADGQVMIFGDVLDAANDEEQEWSFTLQAVPTAMELPPGRTLVGQAYRLTASPGAPDLAGTSISFGYLGEQVPPGEEGFLRIYFWQQDATACQPLGLSVPCWQPLDTFRDPEYNFASAKTQGVGMYALMASMEIPLTGPGWNNFAYPVPYTQTVSSALASLDGYYTIVYGYRPDQPDNEWSVHGPTAPEWANDLKQMEFGKGYLLYATDAITLYLSSEPTVQAAVVEGLTLPPAAIYGVLQPIGGFTPAPGMEVTAWIGDKLCGRSQVQTQDGREVYVVKVAADNGGSFSGCGIQGRDVRIQVGDTVTAAQTAWDNTRMTDTSATQHLVFLPLASR